MTHYVIAQLNIHDRDEYAKYEQGFMEIFVPFGGKLLAVDEAPTTLEGQWSWTRTVVIEFGDAESARAWFDSDAYQALAAHRRAASVGNIVMVKGLGVV